MCHPILIHFLSSKMFIKLPITVYYSSCITHMPPKTYKYCTHILVDCYDIRIRYLTGHMMRYDVDCERPLI